LLFAYRAITLCGRPFQAVRLNNKFVTLRPVLTPAALNPSTPGQHRVKAVTLPGFRLFPVRSPLLGESLLLSFPWGTKMVQFPQLPPHALFYSGTGAVGLATAGFPIRTSPDQSLCAASRSLSQLTTSFIGFRRQGIHHTPLLS
jgi:hypothetical protein